MARKAKPPEAPKPTHDVRGVPMEYCGGRAWRCVAHRAYVQADCECCEPKIPKCCTAVRS